MSLGGDSGPLPPALTPAQHKLFVSAPEVPWRAVDAVVEALGEHAMAISRDAMLVVAVRGAVEAAATYDPARGVEYPQWALYYAIYGLLERLGREHGEDKPVLARIRSAMCGFMAHEKKAIDPWKVTKASTTGDLTAFSDAVLMSGARALGALGALAARGEEGVVELEAAARAGDALRKVVGGLGPEQQWLLEQCAAYGERVTQAAKALGRNYYAVLREYHDLLALMAARLRGLGIKEMPPWMAEVSGQVFEGPPANDGDDG